MLSDAFRNHVGGRPPEGADEAVRPALLPAELSSFVGRDEELREARRLLTEARLVTLKGPGGIGKTRILRRLARQLQEEHAYRDGVVLVELTDVRSNELESAVAEALGIPANSARHGTARLMAHLRAKRLLLMLDNCEHLVDDEEDSALAQLVRTLLETAQDLQIVTTSQAAIRVDGEAWLDIPGLPEDEALQLLRDRARAIRAEIPPEHDSAARTVVNRLDRMPLAIELIAGRMDTVSMTDLAKRTDLPISLAGGTSAKRSHRKLEWTVAWSYGLLGEPEQQLLKRLSLLAGSFELDDAAALGSDLGDRYVVADLLNGLHKRSFMVAEQHGEGQRFKLWESTRAFAYEQLSDEEADELRERHADHYEALACRGAKEYFGPNEPGLLDGLSLALPNLRLAEETRLANPDTVLRGMDLVTNLARTRLFYFIGRLTESNSMLQTALRCHPKEPSHTLVGALSFAATVALCQGDKERADELLVAAEDAARQLGCFDDFGPLLYARATRFWLIERDLNQARLSLPLFDQAEAWFRDQDAPGDAWMARLFQVMAATMLGVREVAMPESARLLADAEAAGAAWCISWARWACALVELLFGQDLGRAVKLAQQALAAQRDMGDKWGLLWSIWLIALIAARLGQYGRAAQLLAGVAKFQQEAELIVPALLPFFELQRQTEVTLQFELEALATEREKGAGLTRDGVVALALQRLSAPPPPAVKAKRPGGLTKREYEVARLIAEGKTNREIADRLEVTLRTAETHVQNVANKLDAHGEGRRGRVVKIREWIEANRPS
ncbi:MULTISPECIES: LuxR C-terminal-related transcriptional regulator [unclassified Amycolatopsis]|uniref:ATP-binding protein n=1 Tax=unclassified Amycolatopsis TaxID=2618356 RepID=UPI0028749DD2|nr:MULTISPECIES: LuxR C-terminal-related transcriptional regulator [unclassified Amycolatopsis]MDS0140583.1 AAA family ATPase [Amycolatopsis sp. 505]MDS0149233.1 AAA family ATPase [Amycolatopsis sp. CM201R]